MDRMLITLGSPHTQIWGEVKRYVHVYCDLFTPKSALDDSGALDTRILEDFQLILACYQQPDISK